MSSELIISSTPQGEKIALLRDKQLVEYHLDSASQNFNVGDIILGKVGRILPGLNAAFVDVGYEKDAFLHYQDLGPQFRSLLKFTRAILDKKIQSPELKSFDNEDDIDKNGKMSAVLKANQLVLVQVDKEPISSKGPRLTCEISLAGRFLVLVPFSDSVNTSKKIQSKEERLRLQKMVKALKPAGFGVIIRTVAEGRSASELHADISELMDKWRAGVAKLIDAKPRDKVIGEMGRASSMMRDLLNDNFDSILTDDRDTFEKLKGYIKRIAPDKEKIVKLHNGKLKLFEASGVERQLKTLFGKTVNLMGGGYLVIEHTEALHVVDVNSGSANKKGSDETQETTALQVNSEAVKEVARQLRLRDMGGIIVVDFIDMRSMESRKAIYELMKDEMRGDRAKFTILPLSKFGLMQITRQRVRPEVNVITHETCPHCNGTGKISATVAVADIVEQNIDHICGKQNEKGITLTVHPFLEAYFTKGGLNSQLYKWRKKYWSWIKIVPDSSLGIVDFKILNKDGEDIELGSPS